MLINFIAKRLIGYEPEKSPENLSEIFSNVTDGFVSFPFNFPGTAYNRCVKVIKNKQANLLFDL